MTNLVPTNFELAGSLPDADSLNRVVKIAVDAGEVASVDAAYELFKTYRLGVLVGPNVETSPTHQAALLTIVNTARRALLGGVFVQGNLNVPLAISFPGCTTLSDAVMSLQGQITEAIPDGVPLVVVGDATPGNAQAPIAVKVFFDGWKGGVIPLPESCPNNSGTAIVPAATLAAALAVSEVFQHLRGNPMAGRRRLGLSLWEPDNVDWENATPGPVELFLPSRLWLIGLGHLGQAYLWVLGLLPFANPSDVQLVLHDFDRLAASNDSTSILTNKTMLGRLKTRAIAEWLEARGFNVRLIEREFPGGIKVLDDEPKLALGGVDNSIARAAYEDVGFDWIVESGLGAGPTEYLALRLHTFPASCSARKKWGDQHSRNLNSQLELPAYQDLSANGMDQCGLVKLATRTVGAPFVGTVAASLVIAEVLRYLNGGSMLEVIDMTLRDPNSRSVVESATKMNFNPGFTSQMKGKVL